MVEGAYRVVLKRMDMNTMDAFLAVLDVYNQNVLILFFNRKIW